MSDFDAEAEALWRLAMGSKPETERRAVAEALQRAHDAGAASRDAEVARLTEERDEALAKLSRLHGLQPRQRRPRHREATGKRSGAEGTPAEDLDAAWTAFCAACAEAEGE